MNQTSMGASDVSMILLDVQHRILIDACAEILEHLLESSAAAAGNSTAAASNSTSAPEMPATQGA